MRGQQHRLPEAGKVLHHLPGLAPCRGVEAGCGLVEEEQVRVPREGDRNVKPSLLAPRELEDAGVPLLLQPDDRDDLVDRSGGRIEACVHRNRLGHREVAVNAGRLEHDADARLQLGTLSTWVDAEHGDVAAVAPPVALEDLHRRRLAGAVGPQQGEHLAAPDLEVDAAHGLQIPVGLLEPAHLDSDVVTSQLGHATSRPGE